MSAQEITLTLGGRWRGSSGMVCCPAHDDRTPSLSISDGDTPGRILVHCFAGCDGSDILAELRRRGLLDHTAPIASKFRTAKPRSGDAPKRTATALAWWRESQQLRGSVAEQYLKSRGVRYYGEALRFHARCRMGGEIHPVMIGLIRSIETNEPQGVHRTALLSNGSGKAAPGKMMLGHAANGCVKLTDDAEVTTSLCIAEGIETALAVRNLPKLENMALWACLSAGTLSSFPVLAGIESLWIAADHDAAGIKAARQSAARWHGAGKEVILLAHKTNGADLNDIARVV